MVYFFRRFWCGHILLQEIGILRVNLKNISLDDNFDEDDTDTIILIRFWLAMSSDEKKTFY